MESVMKVKKPRKRAAPKRKFKGRAPEHPGPAHLSGHQRAKLIAAGKLRLLPNGGWSMDAES